MIWKYEEKCLTFVFVNSLGRLLRLRQANQIGLACRNREGDKANFAVN
jgi:hypothetical protein